MGSCLSSLPDIQKNIISLFCISLLTQDVYSQCIPRVCEATERQFKYVRFPQLGCIWWARAPWGVYSHSHQFSLSLLLCVWHIGSPCCLGWHCVTLLCVCVCERECEKKSRGKKKKKNEKRPPYPLAQTWVLWYSSHINVGWNPGYQTPQRKQKCGVMMSILN